MSGGIHVKKIITREKAADFVTRAVSGEDILNGSIHGRWEM